MRSRRPFHAVAWLVWAVAAAASVQLAPSPVYVALVVLAAVAAVEAHARDSALARLFPALLVLGAAFALLRVVLTAATTHGVGDVLVRLPEATLPRLLGGFTVGGTVELPVVLQSAAEGFAIVGVMAAFGAFNAVVSHHELVQAAPRAFHEPGLVVTVALAFVPSTVAAVHAVREADRARTGGHVVRRGRLVRLAVPILESGMERAVRLAESMDARGFARLAGSSLDRTAAWLGLASLLAMGGAFVALVGGASPVALAAAVAGIGALVAAVALSSRSERATRYRLRAMDGADWALAGTALAAPLLLALLGHQGEDSLRWSVEPLAFPAFSAAPAVAVALLALPALWPSAVSS